jgi:hypothetical protein
MKPGGESRTVTGLPIGTQMSIRFEVHRFFRQKLAWALPKALRKRTGWGCFKCGSTFFDFGYPGLDGKKRVDYCIDCWPGYESCGTIGCNHYECEHSHGEVWTTSYVKPGMEDVCGNVGDEVHMPKGCMNAGCPCTGFITRAQRDAQISDIGHARREAYWKLSEMEGVEEIKSEVQIVVNVTILAGHTTRESREKIYAAESELMREHPNVLFDFVIR